MRLHFDPCFDQQKLAEIAPHLPATYAALDELAPWMKGRWPTEIHCMSNREIVRGRKKGAGHGFTFPGEGEIWLNPHLTTLGVWLVLVHESLHSSHPDATEGEINCVLVPAIYERVFGQKLTPQMGRQHGLGSPVPGVGDRSFCR